MTGRELVELAGRLRACDATEATGARGETLELVGLADAAGRRIGGYSGGMRQRLGIAQALVARAAPADPRRAGQLARSGGPARPARSSPTSAASATVLFSTHVLADVERICDRVGDPRPRPARDRGAARRPARRVTRCPLYRIEPEPGQEAGGRGARRAAAGRAVGRRGSTSDRRRRRRVASPTQTPRSAELLPLVVAAGVRLAVFERVRPSLEDVFLRLVGRDGDAADDAAVGSSCARSCSSRGGRSGCRSSAGCSCSSGSSSPLLARFLPEIIEAAAGDQLPTIPVPTPVPADAVDQLWKNLAQFGAIAAILLAMGAVATETGARHGRVHPVEDRRRGARSSARSSSAIGAGPRRLRRSLAVAVGWVYTAILFEPLPVAGWIALRRPRVARPRAPGRRSRSSAAR